ncbi:MAG TPA: hypothetical protein VFW71_00845 [Actinomycetota bacterium]|nr:hypothetical protein [Actinomycetota bacterium]
MATCRTCGATIEVPEGWSVGPAARRHYWAEHPDAMLRHRADRAAEESLPAEPAKAPKPKRRKA